MTTIVLLSIGLICLVSYGRTKSPADAVGYSLIVALGLVGGVFYGDFLQQPHLMLSSRPWPMVGSMLLGTTVAFIVAVYARPWWRAPVGVSLDRLAARARRCMKFRLTTLIIVVSLIAVGLGFYRYHLNMQRPIRELLRRNLTVSYLHRTRYGEHYENSLDPPTMRWLDFSTDKYLGRVRGISRRDNCNIRDEDMKLLTVFPELERLSLYNNRITGAGLQQISHLRKLTHLDLRDNLVEDAGLAHLSGMSQLRHLNLSENKLTDEGLAHLANFTELRELDLSDNGLTGDGLKHLSRLTKLQVLDLSENNILGPELRHLGTLESLHTLSFMLNPLTEVELVHLEALQNLHTLHLNGSQIGDSQLVDVGKIPGLQILWLTGTGITDASVPHLSQASRLRGLSIQGTRISRQGEAKLWAALPKCQIDR